VCGIAGIVDITGERPIDRALLERMNGSLRHRGPDGDGVHIEPGVGLAHRRLSIIDLSGGAQPLYNEDGTVAVTFNGEIYNFGELTGELAAAGHTFRTHSDTEVIVHAWEQWGADCVRRFNGMFAFAIWDRTRRTLFLARDRLGVKPLYYGVTPDGFLVFGSELKSLLLHPGVRRELDVRAVEDYFAFGYVPDPRTILASVAKLPPASTLEIVRARPVPPPRQYWDVAFRPAGVRDENHAQGELIDRLREATRKRLMSEVPLGAFLSGGVDSSAVVAMMAEVSAEPVRTCSIAFNEPEFDESRYAQIVAERFATRHKTEAVDVDDFDLLDRLVDVYDEPFADSSAIPTYRVCELARRHVTVALSGDGGDESFAGYRRYRLHMMEERLRSALPAWLRCAAIGPLGSIYPKLDWAPRVFRAKTTLQSLARSTADAYFHTVTLLPTSQRRQLLSAGFRKKLQGYEALEVFRHHLKDAPVRDGLSLVQYLDYKTYLPGDILTKVDRASMAHGLEVRGPFLDYELVDWVSGLPEGWKLRGSQGKHVLTRALDRYLPREVLHRKKMGFAVPIQKWFRGPLRQRLRDTLLGERLAATGIFDPTVLARLLEQHESGRRDHSPALWSLLMFDGSMRRLGLA
jgi:asparagine synthase (glutamine-hydrolysing)